MAPRQRYFRNLLADSFAAFQKSYAGGK